MAKGRGTGFRSVRQGLWHQVGKRALYNHDFARYNALLNKVLNYKRSVEKGSMATATGECEQLDRRITRSKHALRAALIELTREQGLDGFTVNDLCERADLNRGTFYNHFKDKDDLLVSLQREFLEGLDLFRAQMQTMTLLDLAKLKVAKKPLPVLVSLFDYLRDESDLLIAMLGPGGDARFDQQLRDGIFSEFILNLLHARYRERPSAFVDYYVSFYSAAYLGVIHRWLQTGMKESSEEMARIAMRLLFIKPGESITL